MAKQAQLADVFANGLSCTECENIISKVKDGECLLTVLGECRNSHTIGIGQVALET